MESDKEKSLATVAEAVEKALGVPFSDITGRSRKMKISDARIILSFHLSQRCYGLSDIARAIGRTHPTVYYQLKQYPLYLRYNSAFREKAQKVRALLRLLDQQCNTRNENDRETEKA